MWVTMRNVVVSDKSIDDFRTETSIMELHISRHEEERSVLALGTKTHAEWRSLVTMPMKLVITRAAP